MKWNRISVAKRLILSKKYAKAKKLLVPLARKGNVSAQYMLGYLYFAGDTDTKREDAKYWLTLAARKGHVDAQLDLAATNLNDGTWTTTPASLNGIKKLERAARKGSAKAQRDLACTYAVGETIPYDATKARYWYTKAANQGYSEAQNDIGGMLLFGEGGEVDVAGAIFWYERCASIDQNVPYARWAAETLSEIYAGNFDTSYIDMEKQQYWDDRSRYLDDIPFRPHPDWFYD